MRRGRYFVTGAIVAICAVGLSAGPAQKPAPKPAAPAAPAVNPKVQEYKQAALADVEGMTQFTQQFVDQVFSFGELGFQEFETSKYITDILRKNGFTVEEGIAGIPTAWMATWGQGKPVIAMGTDLDCIPQASQKPGVAYRDQIIVGAPGHGEGHNSGQAVNVTAALAVKKIMEREKLPGTIKIWPGVAEEQLGTKAYYVRDGYFKGVDIVLYNHVGSNLATGWGDGGGNGLVSIEYMFKGESAHSAGAPWRGKSALDAVELMNIGWNYKREHLRISQRSHYVVTDGGDQPNVVPSTASVWYYFRETSYPEIMKMWDAGNKMAEGATLMTGTTFTQRTLGTAWPGHMNKRLAEVMYENIKKVGLPQWSEADLTLARETQKELGVPVVGLATKIPDLRGRESMPDEEKRGGGSDDIGDISWNVPTVSLSFPSNFQAGPGHNWANAIPMATPIAHKGATAGAMVMALTLLDIVTTPAIVKDAWDYFSNVQTKDTKYVSFLKPTDKPAIWLNQKIMERYRPEMKKFYYDPTKYKTYLEQLGIKYPTVRTSTPQQ
ncbi:MAG: amidohydrolase [Vicinamibacterales bacterium]